MGRNTCEHVFGASLRLCSLRSHLILQASFRQYARSCLLAALVLEIDTIPKPHGLGQPPQHINGERSSINVGQNIEKIEFCPKKVRVPCGPR
jgi:hypothetical protein